MQIGSFYKSIVSTHLSDTSFLCVFMRRKNDSKAAFEFTEIYSLLQLHMQITLTAKPIKQLCLSFWYINLASSFCYEWILFDYLWSSFSIINGFLQSLKCFSNCFCASLNSKIKVTTQSNLVLLAMTCIYLRICLKLL